VLVSEVMLQQTPVSRVIPAWREWMKRWPVPADLAAATPAEVIRAWDRLGYPRRALRLRAAALAIVERHGGQVPGDIAALERLPGIGTYTARAVAAFAFKQRQPVVDTNVRRLTARFVRGRPDAGLTTTKEDLATVAAELPADAGTAALASAAFMEIGALLCTARAPACDRCPLAPRCAWQSADRALPTGPTRRPQAYAGTDRYVRGLILAALRATAEPVPAPSLLGLWADAVQLTRALNSLEADGLISREADAWQLPISS
jgi:A/G-specific adenine glycosylase